MRLDVYLQSIGAVKSRTRAKEYIESGYVSVNGKNASKPSLDITDIDVVSIEVPDGQFVGRGAKKLDGALDSFGIDPSGKACIDVGASTGGFTDCLLQQGASKVFAIDVGYGQLDWKIRSDPRVVVMERTNVRYVTPEDLGEPLDLSVIDVSFISLRIVLPVVKTFLKQTGQVLCLIKPQFEAGKEAVAKGKGVVRDPAIHKEVLDDFVSLTREIGFTILGLTFSPVKGPEGNIEFLAHLTLDDKPGIMPDTASVVSDAHNALKG